ncbi:hypothetical protein LCGC14_2973760, partial [marine sediment metagenome]
MSKFYSRFGKACRYKFLDKVMIKNRTDNNVYYVINAKWIGNSTGFWEVFLETKYGIIKTSVLRSSCLKKVKLSVTTLK